MTKLPAIGGGGSSSAAKPNSTLAGIVIEHVDIADARGNLLPGDKLGAIVERRSQFGATG